MIMDALPLSYPTTFESAVMIAASLFIISACIGLWRFKERENIIYARVHIAGVVDVACIMLMLFLGQPLVALTYFMLTPLSAHSIVNAKYYRTEEKQDA